MEPQIKLNIVGMTCGHCESSVRRALEAVDGVVSVEVDRGAGAATVAGSVAPEVLVAAVEDQGFDAAVA